MPSKRTLYWDACVMLSYINRDKDRIGDLDALLAEAARNEVVIISSVLSVAEVAFAAVERTGKALDDKQVERIDKLWAPIGQIRLVEFHVLIAEGARDIQRLGVPEGWTGLRSIDAMHLATARQEGVDAFHTYEPKLLKWAAKVGYPIIEPFATQPLLGLEVSPP
jgi:predicted nucleic acid-binding protein